MKESITKFDLEAAFKALDEIDVPVAKNGIRANKPALTEIFSRKSKFDALFEEYYDVGSTEELSDAKEAREAEVAKAKLARIEKIVDLDAESPEDLLTSYVGKFIVQCPQCMTLFYKNPEDVEESEDDATTVNVNEVCQHCGNESGYTLIGKVGEAAPEEFSPETDELEASEELSAEDENAEGENSEESMTDESDMEDFDLDGELEELDLEIEEDETETNESLQSEVTTTSLTEELTEDTDLETSAEDFEKLISSSEFKQPISDNAVRAMINSEKDTEEGSDIKESKSTYSCSNCGYEADLNDEDYDGACPNCHEHHGDFAKLEEGIFDKLKNKFTKAVDTITTSLKSREDKANWILKNAQEDYENIRIDTSGKLIPDEKNQRFHAFVVIGFKENYSNGKKITMAPSFNNKDLVVGMKRLETKKTYEEADSIAKGWSMRQGNGPAFIYLAKDADDEKAVFLCEYFKGELEYDQLEKYFEVVKKDLKAGELMAKGGMNQSDDDQDPTEATGINKGASAQNEGLDAFVTELEELHEESLEKYISSSLSESCGNVKSFKMIGCSYLNEKLVVEGQINFKTGASEKTTYIITEAFITDNNQIALRGNNECLGIKEFTITGNIEKETKTFITESFRQ